MGALQLSEEHARGPITPAAAQEILDGIEMLRAVGLPLSIDDELSVRLQAQGLMGSGEVDEDGLRRIISSSKWQRGRSGNPRGRPKRTREIECAPELAARRRDFGAIVDEGTPTNPSFSARWWEGGSRRRKRGFATPEEAHSFLTSIQNSHGNEHIDRMAARLDELERKINSIVTPAAQSPSQSQLDTPAALEETELTPAEAETLRDLLRADGYAEIAKAASLHQQPILAAACGLKCQRSTIKLVRQFLSRVSKVSTFVLT